MARSIFGFIHSSGLFFFPFPSPRDLSTSSHQAGSPGDKALANRLFSKFQDYGMKSWTDDHYVKIQDPPVSGSNHITFNGMDERPTGFLSYSACGKVSVRSSALPV